MTGSQLPIKKTHAFLILAHKDPKVVEILIDSLQPLGRVYVHIDTKPMAEFSRILKREDIFVSNSINVKWGHWSMVEATLLLIETAMKDGADRFTLVSGDSLPIVSKAKFENLLDGAIDICHHRPIDKSENSTRDDQYYRRYFSLKEYDRLLPRAINAFSKFWPIPINITKYLAPLELQIGSAFWSITRSTMIKILEHHKRNPKFAKYFHKIKLSDETFFQTLTVCYSNDLNGTGIMFANWDLPNAPHPSALSSEILEDQFKSGKFFFARKFSTDDSELLSTWSKLYEGHLI